MQRSRFLKLAARMLVAVALLALVIWLAHPAHLADTLLRADARLFALALVFAILSNVASAIRWAYIARVLGLIAPMPTLIAAYARGMVLNALLPGATLSGDVLRAYSLRQLGNPLGLSTLSVVLDRASGLWVLCLLSGSVAIAATLLGLAHLYPRAHALASSYLLAIGFAAMAPAALFVRLPENKLTRWWREAADFLARVVRSGLHLRRQVGGSLAVQLLSAAALWACAQSVGITLPYWVIVIAAAPIFIMAAIPLGFAGWGTRELAAIAVLAAFGANAEQAAASSILYGLCAIAQALLSVPLMLHRPLFEQDKDA